MNDRLDKLLLAEQLTPAKFADIIGVQRSSISHIISGRNKPSFDFIAKVLHKFPRVNSEWLIMGKGEMYKQMVQASLFDEPVTASVSETEKYSNILDEELIPEPEVADHQDNDIVERVSQPTDKSSSSPKNQTITSLFGKDVERIVVFYTDRTFRSYTPSEE